MRRNKTTFLITLACLGAYAFFGWHAKYGARSFSYQASVREKLALVKLEHDQIVARRKALEAHVRLLRPESLDADMLDEKAREMLGYARDGEIVSLGGR
jgi:cell division protein FtsB